MRCKTCIGPVVTREEGTNGYLLRSDTSYPRSHLSHPVTNQHAGPRPARARSMSAPGFLYFRADNKAPSVFRRFHKRSRGCGGCSSVQRTLSMDAKIRCWNIGDDLRVRMNRRVARKRGSATSTTVLRGSLICSDFNYSVSVFADCVSDQRSTLLFLRFLPHFNLRVRARAKERAKRAAFRESSVFDIRAIKRGITRVIINIYLRNEPRARYVGVFHFHWEDKNQWVAAREAAAAGDSDYAAADVNDLQCDGRSRENPREKKSSSNSFPVVSRFE